MSLSDDAVAHVAMLARLGLGEEERAALGAQLDAILDHIAQLNRVDTSAVPETAQVGVPLNVWREDLPRASITVERALEAAPDRDGDYFRVGAIQE